MGEKMKKQIKWLFGSCLLILLLTTVALAGEKPKYGGTFTGFVASDPIAWDPWFHNSGGGGRPLNFYVFSSVYEKFTGGDWSVDRDKFPFTMYYVPPKYSKGYSMESYEVENPLTYVIHLRKGMRFHDKEPVNGREVTAHDAKYSIDRTMGLGKFKEKGASPKAGTSAWKIVKSVDVRDRYTIAIHLEKPSALFTEYWGTELCPIIIPREVVDKYGDNFNWKHVVGSGPFQLVDQINGSSFTFEKHPNYYGRDERHPENRIPYIDKLKVLVISDPATQEAGIRTGKIDLHWDARHKTFKSIRKTNPEIKYIKVPTACPIVELRVDKKPYKDIRVRRAMQMAIDIKGINRDYYEGSGGDYPFMILPAFPDYFTPLEEMSKDVQEAFTYNPEKARALLKEAGYSNGFTQELPLSSVANTEQRDLTNLFIAYWEDIGIKTKIRTLEGAAYSSFVYGGKQDMAWLYTCGFWMPTQILVFFYGGQKKTVWNFSNANDPEYNARWDAIQTETDQAKRDRMLKEAFVYGTSQFFYTAGPTRASFRMWQPWIKGYQGEYALQAVSYSPTVARIWIDQDLKRKRTGR